jgi:hypothetical protein
MRHHAAAALAALALAVLLSVATAQFGPCIECKDCRVRPCCRLRLCCDHVRLGAQPLCVQSRHPDIESPCCSRPRPPTPLTPPKPQSSYPWRSSPNQQLLTAKMRHLHCRVHTAQPPTSGLCQATLLISPEPHLPQPSSSLPTTLPWFQTNNCWQNCSPSCPGVPVNPDQVLVSGDRCKRAGEQSGRTAASVGAFE